METRQDKAKNGDKTSRYTSEGFGDWGLDHRVGLDWKYHSGQGFYMSPPLLGKYIRNAFGA